MIAKLGRSFGTSRALRALVLRVAVSLVLSPTQGYALGTENERAACAPDVFRLCSPEIPDVDRIIACMKAKRASLSVACRTVFDAKLPEGTAQNVHQAP
jgi:hypothetical protein